ncbi:MAG TPA: DinB family protein [Sphingobacteriaceae bacterium]
MLKDLLKYTEAADKRVITAMNMSVPPEKAIALFSHVLSAQHIWVHRILGLERQYAVHHVFDPSEFSRISENNMIKLWSIFSDRNLNTIITYTNTAGDTFSASVRDILFHVINHSTYHRAQIATELRQAGLEPPVTDYIILRREGVF